MKDCKPQFTQGELRKLVHSRDEHEAFERLVERFTLVQRPREEILEELVHCFLLMRDSVKQGSINAQEAFPKLIAAFGELARKGGIAPENFYGSLLEKIVAGSEPDEGPRTLLKQSTKEKILDAALEVFSEKGFHLATVDEIAELAGFGKGTLYRYFANKETLFNELVRLRLEELEQRAMAVLDGQDDVLTMISKYLRIYFEFFDRNQRLYRVIVHERLDVGEQVQDLYFKKVIRRVPTLKRKILEASQQGILKDVDFQTVFYGTMGFVHGVIEKWLARDCSYSLVEELPGVVEVLFYGFVRARHDDLVDTGGKNG